MRLEGEIERKGLGERERRRTRDIHSSTKETEEFERAGAEHFHVHVISECSSRHFIDTQHCRTIDIVFFFLNYSCLNIFQKYPISNSFFYAYR